MNYLIGVDIGTQGTKTTLRDEQGGLACEAFQESNLIYPERDAVIQDPEEILDSVLSTIRQVVERSGVAPGSVAAIGMSGQMAGIMGVAADGSAATPYDSWLDTRCAGYRQPFLDYGEEKVIALTGTPVTYAHGPKILWWKGERPEVYEKIRRFTQPSAYCALRMCGLGGEDGYIDHTFLHFSGFADNKNRAWSRELLDALGVDADKMPRILRPYDKVGGLTGEMAARCGLLSGTAVVAGCGDTAATSFGSGIVRPGLLLDVAGTAAVLACATDVYAPDTNYKTIMYAPSVVDGLYTPMAYLGGGGMCLKWLRDDVLGGTKGYAELDQLAADVVPGSDDLIFLPHFSGRVCPNDNLVRGAFLNLTWKHTAAHMHRAVMEGIAYEYAIYADIIHELIPSLSFERIVSVGGGSKSRVFGQIKADLLGTAISTVNLADTAALGCCVIAGYGVGLYSSLTTPVEQAISQKETIPPRAEHTAFYQQRKRVYAESIEALHGVYGHLQTLQPWRKQP